MRSVISLRAGCDSSGRRRRLHGEVVVAPDARADPGHVGPVDMDRDRGEIASVADAVDVSGRSETAHLTGPVQAAARLDEAVVLLVEREQLLPLRALDHPEHAPGDVVMDWC